MRRPLGGEGSLKVADGFSVRASSYKDATLVNVCDQELIGRTVSEGKLKVNISPEFYSGQVVGEGEALRLIRTCSIVNLAGRRSVRLAVDNSLASAQAVREIEGVPFLMIYKFGS